jgi:hypothetical protein
MPKNARAATPFMEAVLTKPAPVPVLDVLAEVLVEVPFWVLAAPELWAAGSVAELIAEVVVGGVDVPCSQVK